MQMNRREFVAAAAATCACLLCPSQMLAAAETSGPVDVGTPQEFDHDGVYDRWAKSNGFFVVRDRGKLYATSSTCTHRSVVKVVKQGEEFVCPRHGSRYSLAGELRRGPARRALPRYGITLNAGRITVDPSQRFEQGKWNEPAAFVKVG